MTIISILLLTTLVEGFVEYAFSKIKALEGYLLYVSLAAGVLVAFAYNIDIFQSLGLDLSSQFDWVDYVMSGLIIGRGSNYINDIISRFNASTAKNVAEAKVKVVELENVSGGATPDDVSMKGLKV